MQYCLHLAVQEFTDSWNICQHGLHLAVYFASMLETALMKLLQLLKVKI